MLLFFLIPVVNLCIPTQQVETTSTTTTTTTTTSTTTTTPSVYCCWRSHSCGQCCAAEGAVVSGVQNQAELQYMQDSYVSLYGSETGSFWVGAKRTAACLESQLTLTCNALNSLEWTDGSTTGTDGFLWRNGDPNNGGIYYPAYKDNCLAVDARVGLLADQPCGTAHYMGYGCGKTPM
ncbi:C-type lectin domain-containing protein [Caenorhabditis elegans]|uniref:C-type lectin domain-containing protein n=1 Tax=Caenorhabditis elegans TaxID=6239 RepID=G5EG12_CAEEL|nr:C-type lectin domain-containing protein [Caenorhabditis elegans]CAA19554.3 C-type lectin domain-containing protein [Caenorhabditis elegans]|eukprot:NP_507370.2 C-type LECtin [Caenorhabditis elegans]